MPGAVIVGYIQSPEGKAALDAAVREAWLRKARLVVVNSAPGGRESEAQVIAVRDALAEIETSLTADGLDVSVLELARGNAAAEDLVDVAKEQQADLIVIGLRRRSPVGKLILGSNAQDILLSAECPVLAVKAPQD